MGANASNGTKYLAGCPPIPPAPIDSEVQQQFQELLQSKHVTHSVVEALCTIETNETKWMYLCLAKWLATSDTNPDATKEWLDPRLATQEILDLQLQHECISELCRAVRINLLLRSKTKLTGVIDWADQFVTENGVEALLVPLDPTKKQLATTLVYTEVVHVLLTLSNGNRGMMAMSQPSCVLRLVTMAFAAVGPAVFLQSRLLQLLGMICCHSQPSQQTVVTVLRSLSPDARLTALATSFFDKLNEKGEDALGPLAVLTFINIVLNTTRTSAGRSSLREDFEQSEGGSLIKTLEEWKATGTNPLLTPEMDIQIQVFLKSYRNDSKTIKTTVDSTVRSSLDLDLSCTDDSPSVPTITTASASAEPRKSLRLDLQPLEKTESSQPLVIELISPTAMERRPSLSALPSLSIPTLSSLPSSDESIPVTVQAPEAPPASAMANVLSTLQQLDQATQDKVLSLLTTLTTSLTTQSEPQSVLERMEKSLLVSTNEEEEVKAPLSTHEEEEEHSPRRSMTETESYESSSSLYESSSSAMSVVKPTSIPNPKLALQGFFQHLKKGQALPSTPAPTPMATASVKKDAKRPVFTFANGALPPSTPMKMALTLPALTPAKPQIVPGTPMKPPIARPIESSTTVETTTIPDVSAFRKLLSMGAPKAAVRVKMQQAGLNPDWLEVNPSPSSVPSAPFVSAPSEPVVSSPLPPVPVPESEPSASSSSTDDSVSKFRKLLSMGAPLAAVKAKMIQAGVDPTLLDQKPIGFASVASPPAPVEASKTVETPEIPVDGPVKVRDHPDYIKFFKLQSMGAPVAAVKAKIIQAGLDPSLLDTPDAFYPTATSTKGAEASEPTAPTPPTASVRVKEDPDYAKFFKLQTMGAPSAAVKAKMVQAGLNPDLLETPDAPLPKKTTLPTVEKPLLIKEDPKYANFFKLLAMGSPIEAVKAKMRMAGLDSDVLDTPEAVSTPTSNQASNHPFPNPRKAALALAIKPTVFKPTTRSFYWQQIKKTKIKGTIWEEIGNHSILLLQEKDLNGLEIDFPAPSAPLTGPGTARGRSVSMDMSSALSPRSSVVFLLDRSRSNNISIIMKQFRMSPLAIREAIMKVDTNVLTMDRIQGLIKILPTEEEVASIMGYTGDVLVLNEAERVVRELLTVPRLKQRLLAIQSMLLFPLIYKELQVKIEKLRNATIEIETNSEWKNVLYVVLQVGNKMNMGTNRGNAMGFQLNDLLKLNQLKATTDKSMTLLHTIARFLRENSILLSFSTLYDVQNIPIAELPIEMDKVIEMMDYMTIEVNAQVLKNNIEEKEKIDTFVEVMNCFLTEASIQTIGLRSEMKEWIKKIKELMRRFGFTGNGGGGEEEEEEEKKEIQEEKAILHGLLLAAVEFFTIVYGFHVALTKADRENEVKRVRDEQRMKQMTQKSISKPILGPRSLSSMDMLRKEKEPESVEKKSSSPARRSPLLRQRSASLSSLASNNNHSIENVRLSTPPEQEPQTQEPQTELMPAVVVTVSAVEGKEQTPETPDEEMVRTKPVSKTRIVTPPKKKREGIEGSATKPPPTPKKKNKLVKGTNNQQPKAVLTVPGKIIKTTATNMKQQTPLMGVVPSSSSTRSVS